MTNTVYGIKWTKESKLLPNYLETNDRNVFDMIERLVIKKMRRDKLNSNIVLYQINKKNEKQEKK